MTGPLFPENYSKIWIRGRFITMAGVAVRGKLTLAPTVTNGGLVNRSLKLIMSAAAFSADTDNDGYVAVQVPATNDPDITPINFTYAVTTPIGQKFSIVVPYDTTLLNSVGDPLHGQPVIELIDVVPVGSSGGVGQLLRGIGIQSMVDNGAGGLLITYTDGATSTVAMPDTVQGPAGPVGPAGPAGPTGPTGPAGSGAAKLVDLTDVTTAGAAVGKHLAVTQASGGVLQQTGLVEPVGGAGTTTPEALGAVGDGTTDDTAAFQTFLTGGTATVLVCDPSKTYRINGQLTYTAAGVYRRITSNGGVQSELFKTADNPGGAVLDLRYAGAGAKIVGLQRGTLELDHIALVDRGTSSSPFLMVTNCAPKVHDCVFMGNPAKNGNLCDQDAVILGGTDSTTTPGLPNGAFQGYTGFIRECSFHKIRRAVTWQNYANSVSAIRNTINPTCGSTLAVDAPFVLDTGTANAVDGLHFASGNTIADNLIEIATGYAHGIILRNMASSNYIEGNHFWDAHTPAQGGKYISEILCDQASGASGNRIFQTGASLDQSVTGISNGTNNLVFTTKRFVTPPNWVLALKGDVTGNNNTLSYEVGTDGPVLTGWAGVGIRNMQSGGSGSLIAIRAINAATPNSSIPGNVGDICLTRNGGAGTTLWVKESGNATNTGWVGYGAASGGGSSVTPPFPGPGYYLHTSSPGAFGTSSSLGVGTLRLTPWWVPRALNLSAFLAQVGTVGEAGSKFRVGVYSDTGSNAPGALLLDAGQIATDVTGFQSVTASLNLTPGLYWIGGAVQSVTTTQPQLSVPNQYYSPPVPITASTGTTWDTIAGALMGVNMTGVTGALPTTFAATGATANVPRVTVKVA